MMCYNSRTVQAAKKSNGGTFSQDANREQELVKWDSFFICPSACALTGLGVAF